MRIENHFHINSFALSLAKKTEACATREKPIAMRQKRTLSQYIEHSLVYGIR